MGPTELQLLGFGPRVEEGVLRGGRVVDGGLHVVEGVDVLALGLLLQPAINKSVTTN